MNKKTNRKAAAARRAVATRKANELARKRSAAAKKAWRTRRKANKSR